MSSLASERVYRSATPLHWARPNRRKRGAYRLYVLVNKAFENTDVGRRQLCRIIRPMLTSKKGISSSQI